MKALFFYQELGSDEVQGFKCEVRQIKSVKEFTSGFVVSTFEKDVVYNLLPEKETSISSLDELELMEIPRVESDFEKYQEVVQKAISFCSEIKGKVVISRIVQQDLPEDFSLKEYFVELCKTYSHSFNYCLSQEDGTIWVGATPEVLISSNEDQFNIHSLAGSRDANNPFEWTLKEKEEQQFVTNEVKSTLDSRGIDYKLEGPITVQAGNVEHLRSNFTLKTDKPLELVDELHPTPAICGIPRKAALQFIKDHETHDRSLYTGIIGWKNRERTVLYVNLRCAKIFKGVMECYVGGGITKDSDPLKEWEETKFKSQTLLSVLKKNRTS